MPAFVFQRYEEQDSDMQQEVSGTCLEARMDEALPVPSDTWVEVGKKTATYLLSPLLSTRFPVEVVILKIGSPKGVSATRWRV